ncbi:MAG TPA: hypothetical protein VN442_05395 [Bryobacteraceae bacterium]|nr:hypothetical protein [Bryobacteraceae bacterium]
MSEIRAGSLRGRRSGGMLGAVTGQDAHDRAPAPEYSEDGVDLSLVRWMLSLTPLERLRFLEERINDILEIRERNARTFANGTSGSSS